MLSLLIEHIREHHHIINRYRERERGFDVRGSPLESELVHGDASDGDDGQGLFYYDEPCKLLSFILWEFICREEERHPSFHDRGIMLSTFIITSISLLLRYTICMGCNSLLKTYYFITCVSSTQFYKECGRGEVFAISNSRLWRANLRRRNLQFYNGKHRQVFFESCRWINQESGECLNKQKNPNQFLQYLCGSFY